MAYVASVKRIPEMLATPGTRLLVAVSNQPYATVLLKAIGQRIDEGNESWHGALLFLLAEKVVMPNGSEVTIKCIENIEQAHMFSGQQWTYLLTSYQLDDDVKAYLEPLVRATESYAGKVGFEQFEEWRDNPLRSQPEKEKND